MTDRAIWKFELNFPEVSILIPVGSRFLSVGVQGSTIVVWYEVTPTNPVEQKILRRIPTGRVFDNTDLLYRGTVQIGLFVSHIYEVKNDTDIKP